MKKLISVELENRKGTILEFSLANFQKNDTLYEETHHNLALRLSWGKVGVVRPVKTSFAICLA